MSLTGGLRKNIGDYDFKYTSDNTRKNWIKSVSPHISTIINVVVQIPYNTYAYDSDIVCTYSGFLKDNEETFIKGQVTREEIIYNHIFKLPSNTIKYTFFGGICFEILNDAYPNTNLYDFVDPTSDIDISISPLMDRTKLFDKKLEDKIMKEHVLQVDSKYGDFTRKCHLVIMPSLEEQFEPHLNPYFRDMSDFIFQEMLNRLNETTLDFSNSVSFHIDEYTLINESVKMDTIGYRVEDIENSHAKLIRYLDEDLLTLRIQIVLKIEVGGESIIDHLLEFLIHGIDPTEIIEKNSNVVTIPNDERNILSGNPINISTLDMLIYGNLSAYNEREFEAYNEGPKQHKPINHITRFIYLLDLLKNNPNMYDSLDRQKKINILADIKTKMIPSYLYYKVINKKFTLVTINTIDIIYAFYSVFCKLMQQNSRGFVTLSKNINNEITKISQDEENNKYNSLITLFRTNASPFSRILSEHPLRSSYNIIGKNIKTTPQKKTHRKKHTKTHRKKHTKRTTAIK